jgi:hypothetical protein
MSLCFPVYFICSRSAFEKGTIEDVKDIARRARTFSLVVFIIVLISMLVRTKLYGTDALWDIVEVVLYLFQFFVLWNFVVVTTINRATLTILCFALVLIFAVIHVIFQVSTGVRDKKDVLYYINWVGSSVVIVVQAFRGYTIYCCRQKLHDLL